MHPETRQATSIYVNGERTKTPARTLAELIEALGHGEGTVATALNGAFVPRQDRAGMRLAEGDRVEVLAPRQGG
jgi:sulfur carrier protein